MSIFDNYQYQLQQFDHFAYGDGSGRADSANRALMALNLLLPSLIDLIQRHEGRIQDLERLIEGDTHDEPQR